MQITTIKKNSPAVTFATINGQKYCILRSQYKEIKRSGIHTIVNIGKKQFKKL